MTLGEVSRRLASDYGISVVLQEGHEARTVTAEFNAVPIDDVMQAVARRASASLAVVGEKTYFIGEPKTHDRAMLVRRVRRLNQADLQTAIGAVKSEAGQVASFVDGVLVFGDRTEVITKVVSLLDQIEQVQDGTWCVQLYLLDLSARDLADIGADLVPTAEIGAAFANAGAAWNPARNLKLNASFDAVLRASRVCSSSRQIAEPMFYLLDGGESRLVDGDSLPVPTTERVVDAGQSFTRTSYQQVQTGTTVTVKLREVSERAAKLDTSVTLAVQRGFVDEKAPIIGREEFETVALVHSGSVALIGAMRSTKGRAETENGLRVGRLEDDSQRVLQIWVRALRVGSPNNGESEAPAVGRGGATPTAEAKRLPPVYETLLP